MRRINQRYLLATKTSVDVSAVKLPENINDDYFKVRQVFKSVFQAFPHFQQKFRQILRKVSMMNPLL